jgi:peptidoglycan hydrolase CwlO-like protein
MERKQDDETVQQDAKIARLEKENRNLRAQVRRATETEVARLREENRNLRAEVRSLEEQHATQTEDVARLKEEIKSLRWGRCTPKTKTRSLGVVAQ